MGLVLVSSKTVQPVFWHIVPNSSREIVWTPQVFVQLKVTLLSFIIYFTVQA